MSTLMLAEDLLTIFDQVPDTIHGDRPFIVHEMYCSHKKCDDFIQFGRAIQERVASHITNAIRNENFRLLGTHGDGLWNPTQDNSNEWTSDESVAYIDNHNTGQYDKGYLYYGNNETERLQYKMGLAWMLASDFGVKRLYSTFFMGGQHIFPDPNLPVSCGSESTYIHSNGANTFVCQHRWRVVRAMVTFANHVQDTPAERVWSRQSSEEEPHTDAIVFSRGSRGMFAMGPGLEILGVSQDHPGKE